MQNRRELQTWLHSLYLGPIPLAPFLQPYTFFLSALAGSFIAMLVWFAQLMQAYNWLDPADIHLPDLNVTHSMIENGELEIQGWLRVLCIMSPLAVLFTFVITLIHLRMHLPRERGFDDDLRWYPSFSHDLAMQVAVLPLVYGIFSLASLFEMLEFFTGESYRIALHGGVQPDVAWRQSEDHTKEDYKTSFELADLYEAWALRCFGKLCFTLVSRQVRLEVPTVQYLIDAVKSHMSQVAIAESRDMTVLNELVILNNPQKLLYEPLQQTSYLGVRVFVLTYAAKSLYMLSLGILADPPFSLDVCGEKGVLSAMCSFAPYADGAAFLASTLAIYNLVTFEHNMKDILGKGSFRPFEKFLGVKVLVSIAFFQDFGVSVIMGSLYKFSQVQMNLCYSALICCEVLPLSLFLLVAWRPVHADWYEGDNMSCRIRRSLSDPCGTELEVRHGQLADEVVAEAESEDADFIASRQPRTSLAPRPALGDELMAVIELRGEVRAQEGKALEDLINSLSRTVRAQYKPAALFRMRGSTNVRQGW